MQRHFNEKNIPIAFQIVAGNAWGKEIVERALDETPTLNASENFNNVAFTSSPAGLLVPIQDAGVKQIVWKNGFEKSPTPEDALKTLKILLY